VLELGRQAVAHDADVARLTATMHGLGGLSAALGRGRVDGSASWLAGRALGLSSFGCGKVGAATGLARMAVPSGAQLQRRSLTSFKHMWTVSGHMHNPAYVVYILFS
jgi:hypothetical protein